MVQAGPFVEIIDPLEFLDVDITSVEAICILLGVSGLFYILAFVFLKVFVSRLV